MRKAVIPATTYVAVKLRKACYDQLRILVTSISRHGWKKFGSTRADPASFTAVIEEALVPLVEKVGRLGD